MNKADSLLIMFQFTAWTGVSYSRTTCCQLVSAGRHQFVAVESITNEQTSVVVQQAVAHRKPVQSKNVYQMHTTSPKNPKNLRFLGVAYHTKYITQKRASSPLMGACATDKPYKNVAPRCVKIL